MRSECPRCWSFAGTYINFAKLVQRGAEELDIIGVLCHVYLDEDRWCCCVGKRFGHIISSFAIIVAEDDFGTSIGEILERSGANAITTTCESQLWFC